MPLSSGVHYGNLDQSHDVHKSKRRSKIGKGYTRRECLIAFFVSSRKHSSPQVMLVCVVLILDSRQLGTNPKSLHHCGCQLSAPGDIGGGGSQTTLFHESAFVFGLPLCVFK